MDYGDHIDHFRTQRAGNVSIYLLPVISFSASSSPGNPNQFFSKSWTYCERIGNYIACFPWTYKYIQSWPDGSLLNAYGLTNDGILVGAGAMYRSIKHGYSVVPNFFPDFSRGLRMAILETKRAICILKNKLGNDFWIIELNFSCPNDKCAIDQHMQDALALLEAIRKAFPRLKIVVKISYVHPWEFSQEIDQKGLADVIHGINTIPFDLVFPGQISPLADVGGGGVSGPMTQGMAFRYNSGLVKTLKTPMIFGNGVESCDIERCLDAGAKSVSICTDAKNHPQEVGKALRKHNV